MTGATTEPSGATTDPSGATTDPTGPTDGPEPPEELVAVVAEVVPRYEDVPPRLAPLLARFDVARSALDERLEGIDDHEWRWEPTGTVRTIAWLAGHLAEMGPSRADWAPGSAEIGHVRDLDAQLGTPARTSDHGGLR